MKGRLLVAGLSVSKTMTLSLNRGGIPFVFFLLENRWKQSPPQSKVCAPSCLRQMFNIMLFVLILSASQHLKTIHEKKLNCSFTSYKRCGDEKSIFLLFHSSLSRSAFRVYISRIFHSVYSAPTHRHRSYAAECCLG